MRLLVFNPENDMALADGTAGYTPPKTITQFRHDRWSLPKLWARDDDIVWDGCSALGGYDITEVCPWGWSKALVHSLVKVGVKREVMPSDEWIDGVRRLSSRVFTAGIQKELGLDVEVCSEWHEVETFARSVGRTVMKSPWSSSGKGLMMADKDCARAWMERTVRREGAVVCERWMDGRQDFAMEFRIDRDGRAYYMGLSVFHTDINGRYLYNDGDSEEEKAGSIGSQIRDGKRLPEIREWWLHRLETDDVRRYGYYGPMGVDMLVTSDGYVNPCVEINWRMTMGHASLY